jgi:hypothetical protein
LLGGVEFKLSARLELTQEEADLVRRYGVDKEWSKISTTFGNPILGPMIRNLVSSGQTFRCADIGEIFEIEGSVKEVCEAFKNYLEVTKSFGGQEVIEY